MVFNQLINFILEKRIFTLAILVSISLLGMWSWTELDLEAYPDISDIEVTVITQMIGLPAEEMEMQVTVPIERSLNTVPGVIAKRSRTIFGLSVVRLTFDDDTSIYLARQLITEKLKDAKLPKEAEPKLGPMTPSIGEIFRYVVEGNESIPLTQLREIQDYVIIPHLLQAKGVVDVTNFGGLVRQYQVVLNPIQLEKFSLNVRDIADSIHINNRNTGGSFLTIGASQMNIRGIGRIVKREDIENIILDNRNGVPILIKDVGSVELGVQPPTGVLGYVDKLRNKSENLGVEGIVLLRKFENPSLTIDNVYVKIKELNDSILPDGVRIEPFYDRTELVSLTIHTVVKTLLEGTTVVLLVLRFFLGSWRAAILSSLAIPFSLLFAFLCMRIAGIPANLLSLGAIDFGIIVDASIVMMEGIFRGLVKNKGSSSLKETIRLAAVDVQTQIFFAVLIIILALLPILTLQRVEGRLFSPMAWTLSFAILGSLIYSLTALPVLSFSLFKDFTVKSGNEVWLKIEVYYEKLLNDLMAFPRKFLTPVFVFTTTVLLLGPMLGSEFLPELDEGSIWIRIYLPPGISLHEASHFPEKVRTELSKYDEVQKIMTQLGRNDEGTDPYGPNRIETLVELKQPYSSWKSGRTKKEFVLEIKRKLSSILPGANFTITQPIIDTTTENATGSSADLAIFLNGKDLDSLRFLSEKILILIKSMKGSSESSIEQENKQSQLVVSIRREVCARYGINVDDINVILETAIGGFPVSSLYENERNFDIVVRLTEESRNTPETIGKILVTSTSGNRIPLSLLADIHLEEGQTIIFREGGERQLIVKTNIRERDQAGFAKELNERIKKEIPFPAGVTFKLGGQFENLTRAESQLMVIVPLTLLMIYLTLLVFFRNNYIHALIVLSNIPIALAGGVLGLFFRGMHFSISAGVGFVSLFGISVMSGVLLISHLNQGIKKKGENLKEWIVKGSATQFRPRFLVMAIAIIGLLPAAMNSGVGSDVQRPLATVIVGGLFTSLFLTILTSPLLYYIWEKSSYGRNSLR